MIQMYITYKDLIVENRKSQQAIDKLTRKFNQHSHKTVNEGGSGGGGGGSGGSVYKIKVDVKLSR